MKRLLLIFTAIGLAFSSNAQNGTIKGKIETSDNKPAISVNVKLKETSKGTTTGQEGKYSISGIKPGSYKLIASHIGLKTQKVEVKVRAGETTKVPTIELKESFTELKEVVISGTQNQYYEEESSYVGKMPLKKIENPQVYNTVNAEVIEEQVITDFENVMNNAPGVFKLWEPTGRGGDGAGFYSIRGFDVQPSMRNGVPSLTNGPLDPANIERVEIIKGPSGTLYGSSLISYGGLINVVTKKPYNTFGGQVGYTAGSFGLNRLTTDINVPLTEDGDVATRLVSAFHIQNSFQDAGFRRSMYFAPSLSYEVNEDLSFFVNAEIYRGEHTNPTMLFLNRSSALEFENLEELNYNPERSYTSNDITIQNPAFNFQGKMSYEFSENWTSETILSSSNAKTDGYYTYLWDFAASNGQFGRYVNKQNSTTIGLDAQQNFIGDFNLLGMNNKMVVGVDYFSQQTINNSTGYVLFDNVTMGDADPSQISRPAVDTALASAPVNKSETTQNTYSAYISDVLKITSRLSAMASLRFDYFDNQGTYNALQDTTTGDFEQSALSPKFGLMYQPIKDKLSVFANYMNGFSNVEPRTQGDGSTKTFEPEKANQMEAGIKTNFWDQRLTATLTFYDIIVSNVVRMDPNRPNFYIQDGRNYSRGFEASVKAIPIKGMSLIMGYSYNESEIEKTSSEIYEGRRPESAGPQHLVNAWASYRIPRGMFQGFGLGFGSNYASENKILNRKNTGVFALPSYTVFDASLSYDVEKFRIALKLNNLTDETYYKGWTTVNPQMPRNFKVSLDYRF